jgi:UDP-glucose 4-epimerase
MQAALGVAPPLKVFGKNFATPDGTCVRDFVHVSDLGAAHVLALEYLAQGGATVCLNLGTGRGTSVAGVIAAIEEAAQRKVPHSYTDPRPGDPAALYADAARAKQVLGWQAKRDVQEIVRSAWQWELKMQAAGYRL